MFIEKPWTGWGNDATVQPEVGRRIYNFRLDYFVFHNTYLELAVQRGVLGLGLYAWLFLCLFRLRKAGSTGDEPRFLDSQFRKLWPAILVVYLLNASAVVMNYQFVNGLLFSIAGLLSERNPQTTA